MSKVTEKQSALAEFRSGSMETTAEQLAFHWVREAAEPARIGERVCAAIRRAASNLGISYNEAKRYWYGERKAILANEFRSLEYRMALLRNERMEREGRLNELDQRIADLRKVGKLAGKAPEQAREHLDGMGRARLEMGGTASQAAD